MNAMEGGLPGVRAGSDRAWFSRLDLHQEADSGQRLVQVCNDGYQLHQLMWRLFSGDATARRDFVFRAIEGADLLACYLVSSRPPRDLDGVWRVQTKPYAPQLTVGERLIFSLRVNPVVTRKSGLDGKSRRHDVVMDAKKRQEGTGGEIQTAGAAWLKERAGRCGFQMDSVVVEGYRQHRLRQGGQGREIRFSTLDFEGLLTVTDPAALRRALLQGIGPAKGFGCGLLLVRRP
ncbi:MAG: type I-E CRISPR-associated protein Cas6/Cse3/CasE [Magnetococcales bacterium]|nr:type I-E CRISPR-associated protein Cas6/Cse3/CasE [Magnetococcales bacterium]